MAITAPTKLSDFSGFLQPNMAEPYFEAARRASVVQQLVRKVPLGISGESVPYVASKPVAGWVGEGNQKPATNMTLGLKSIAPKKLAAVTVASAEVVRANPGRYMDIYREEIGEAFAITFDAATLHGTNTPFGANTHIGYTSKSVAIGTSDADEGGTYADVVAGLKELVDDGKKLSGFAFDSVAEPLFLGSVDASGRPLFVATPLDDTTSVVTPGRLIGRRAFLGDGVANGTTVGFGGDWSQAVWGAVGGISYRVSTEATVTIDGELVSAFENNLVAIVAEAEYGWLLHDPQAFVKYTATGS